MVKRTVIALSLVLAASSVHAGQNLVANGGFEQERKTEFGDKLPQDIRGMFGGALESPFEDWGFGGGWDHGKYTVHRSTEARSGRYSCEIRCEKKGRGGIAAASFKLKPGSILEVSFWVKAKGGEGGNILLNYEGTAGDGWQRLQIDSGDFDWKKITRRCVVPVRHCREDGQTIVMFVYSKAAGSVWIDDFSAVEIDVNEMAENPSPPALTAPRPKDIPEPAGSPGYRIDVATSLEKVLPDVDYSPTVESKASISMARNEYEGVQIVIETPWREVSVKNVRISELAGLGEASIPSSAVKWNRVDYIETTITPIYKVDRMGLFPDPMMPPGPFMVEALSRSPVYVTVKTPKDIPAGVYRGTITIDFDGLAPAVVPLDVKVWDFAITDETHLKTMTWISAGTIRAMNGWNWSPENNKKAADAMQRYYDILLEHRLGPGGEIANRPPKSWNGKKPDYEAVGRRLEPLIKKGMNAFIMATTPNLKRSGKDEYTDEYIKEFTTGLKPYGDYLRLKGWIDMAYVYTYDEAPRRHWPQVKKIAAATKNAAPELRILQCLNEPEGVRELAGHVDVFDVYVAQYHKTGVQAMQEKGTEAWLAICCYPSSHPNLFIEYPLLDARIAPSFCFKYKAAGFEYWSPIAWGPNWRKKGAEQWPQGEWIANTFGRYNGDGHLLYPGPGGVPYSSIRFESLRDGFEDYEILWQLQRVHKKAVDAGKAGPAVDEARSLLSLNDIIKDSGEFTMDPVHYMSFRTRAAEAVVALKELTGEIN